MAKHLVAFVLSAIWALGAAPRLAQADRQLVPFDATSPAALEKLYSGQPFVLVFWSVNCAPCLADMARWRTYRQSYPGIPVVHVATESLEEAQAIEAVLARHDPGGSDHRAFADDHAERIRFSVDPTWRGETPKAYFYDRNHDRVTRTGALDPEWTGTWFRRQADASR